MGSLPTAAPILRYKQHIERYPALSLVGNTPLFRVHVPGMPDNGAEIWAKAEWMNPGGSVKDRPVMHMLLDALDSGTLDTSRHTILDSSSGNAGIAYAMIGAMIGAQVELVVPGNASLERKKRILAHGASLIETNPLEGYDAALREAHRRLEAHRERYFMPDQYANDSNWRAHFETTAAEILEQMTSPVTHFVSGIGTGGTITGVGRRLKEEGSAVQVITVVPEAFPGIEGLKPLDSPEDIVPKILDQSLIDGRERVTIEQAYEACRSLAHAGVFVGQSSGANLVAAMRIAQQSPKARIVTIFCDIGERYFSTKLWD